MLICEVGINLGGADVGVAEEALDGAEIGAVHEEIGSEGMTESMGSDVLGDAGEGFVLVDDALDAARGEAAVIAVV